MFACLINSDSGFLGFAQKVDPIWNEPVSTGSAGALARYERGARNSYSVRKFEIERAAHAVRARAPALPVLACLFLPHHFLGNIGFLRASVPLWPILLILLLTAGIAGAQTPAAETEVWPKVTASFDLRPQTRLQVYGELQNGEDFPYIQWKVGAMVNYRMKRIVHLGEPGIDEEDEHHLVLGVGYEYLQTTQNDKTKRENRVIVQGTGRHRPGAGFLLTDRNRIEFRWNNGVYDFRYRNKLTVNRAFRVNKFRFTPYASGELFWDRNHHSWGEDQYSFGVQLPYKHRLMLDTFYLHQNCTTCSQQHINVLGLTLNLYFRQKKK